MVAGPVHKPDKTTAQGLFDLPYGIPNQRMANVTTRKGVPVGFWRAVGHSHNVLFSESFIDEGALKLGHGSRYEGACFWRNPRATCLC